MLRRDGAVEAAGGDQMLSIVFAIVGIMWSVDTQPPQEKCAELARPITDAAIRQAYTRFCVQTFDALDRQRIGLEHNQMPIAFGHAGEPLGWGEVCIAGTVVEMGVRDRVPYAIQRRDESMRLLGCRGDERL